MVRERGVPVALALGLRHPELHAVQGAAIAAGRLLGVDDARPALIRLSCPGRMSCSEPSESLCSASPAISHVTVCRPVCGCGPTSSPAVSVTSAGPMWSAKHQAPTVRRGRVGSTRRTLSPPT